MGDQPTVANTPPHSTTSVVDGSTSTRGIGPIFLDHFAESPFLYAFLVINVVLGLSGILLNSLVFCFYVKRVHRHGRGKNHVYHFLYVLLSSCEMMTGLTALAQAVLLGLTIVYTKSAIRPLCYLILFLSSISSHLSVFLNVTISALRTIYIVMPTRIFKDQKYYIFAAVILYTAIWLSLCIMDVVKYTNYNVAASEENIYLFVVIAPRIFILHDALKLSPFVYAVIGIGIPYILPSVICLFSGLVQVYKIYVVPVVTRSNVNQRITVTILTITLIFFCCNTTYMVYYCLAFVQWTKDGRFIQSEQTVICYFMGNFPGFLNAVLNPMVLIIRGQGLRKFTLRLVDKVMCQVKPRSGTTEFETRTGVQMAPWATTENNI